MKEKFKIKTYHRIMAAVMVIAVIFVNLMVSVLSEKLPLKADLTGNEIYSLSKETVNVLKNVDKEVNIYFLASKGNESAGVKQTLDMYKGYSGKIKFADVDPTRDPSFTKNLGVEVSENSVIVKCGDRMKIIDGNAMYDTTFQQQGIISYELEVKLTGAIEYVLKAEDVNVRFTTGHEEIGFGLFGQFLETENATVSEIDLKTTDIPEDTKVLYIAGPKRDFSAEEIAKIQGFVNMGGSLNVSMDVGNSLPLFEQFMKEYYGVEFAGGLVAETEKSKILNNNPLYIIPDAQPHDITNDFISKKIGAVMPQARGIILNERSGIEATPLFKTSDKAISGDDTEVSEAQSFCLAAAITAYGSTGKKAKLIVSGTTLYGGNMFVKEANVANADFLRNSYNYLYGGEINTLSITPKNVSVSYLKLSLSQIILYGIFIGILPPVLVLAAGVFVWFRRRRL